MQERTKNHWRKQAEQHAADADALAAQLARARGELGEANARAKAAEEAASDAESRYEAMMADRNMTQDELDLYLALYKRLSGRWWWKLFARPVVDAFKLELARDGRTALSLTDASERA